MNITHGGVYSTIGKRSRTMGISRAREVTYAALPVRNVAVIDNDEPSRRLLTLSIVLPMVSVHQFVSLEAFEDSLPDRQYAMIVTDLALAPKQRPRQTIMRLRQLVGEHIPILAITTDSAARIKTEALAAGANSILVRPMSPGEIECEIARLFFRAEPGGVCGLLLTLARSVEIARGRGSGSIEEAGVLADAIAQALGESPQHAADVAFSVMVRDIGMLLTRPNILDMDYPFTDDSAAHGVMEGHCRYGEYLASAHGETGLAVIAARTHHEHFNGCGYPAKLRGKAIPLPGRIAAVVDTYCGLRSNRPYRPAVSRHDARAFVSGNAGTRFDPDVVSVFMTQTVD